MNWFLPTRIFKSMVGGEGSSTGLDDSYASMAFEGVGASIMGRYMFGPFAAPGPTRTGRAGGATTLPSSTRSSC